MFAKARISHVGKDFGDPPAGPPLDFFVEVEELDVELLGKQAADTALAAATRPQQDYARGNGGHDGIVRNDPSPRRRLIGVCRALAAGAGHERFRYHCLR